jgi:prepilin-type N-terminal cleavage/methylation domain-containing protein/prepilin-type processing-associated H-X9-DG protein
MRRGLSLIELLTTTSIIAALSGMVLPVVGTVRTAALRAACANNLRQIACAALAYAADSDDCLPAAQNHGDDRPSTSPAWFHRLPEFIGARRADGGIFQCAGFHWQGAQRFANAEPKSLKMNHVLDWSPWPYRLGSWDDEAQLVFFIDGVARETGMGQWGHAYPTGVDASRHHGVANVAYLDGHVRGAPLPRGTTWDKTLQWEHRSE